MTLKLYQTSYATTKNNNNNKNILFVQIPASFTARTKVVCLLKLKRVNSTLGSNYKSR